ncbi:class I SAM-dependent methyltransferase [Rhizobium laguerreae]|uniref:class I SAM-dependent methyltransferase n=1 Tax=Rhizobium laguerreae TaxID=1076926 RepID=UPI00143F9FFD|nr:methyltransferase domain-containing protein [Rhizobium laguerreae]MBY3383976.1 class I SAM-dependent methyltransferase [Rhizobium laguerreae]MBY3418403.1 class I SAM-dependent methyltransferase [Rhizobium laguerreae]NKM16185.1 methyltransferase domain-containing protein [Rhizobium laguerreae]NKN09981.1 methyltransferase domain-containing protein [Rhizobium laguerreae]
MTSHDQTDFATSNASYVSAQSKMALLPNYYKWTYAALRPYLRGKVVELAAGAGYGIESYIDQVSEVVAVDHDAELLKSLQSRHPGVKTLSVDLAGDWNELPSDADAMVMMDVIEHFEDDQAFLKKVFSKLKPGGYALIKVPAQQTLYSEIDVASGHYRRYEVEAIQDLAKSTGFEAKVIRHINVIGALAYKRKRKQQTNFSKTFKSGQLKLINTAIPILALIDNLMPGPGLSLIAVLRRPT